jgi:type VI secretion system protein ImpG
VDPRLLRAYNDELIYLREGAKEFGLEHDVVAGYLGLKTPSDPDPYVERLLEGVAFLAARVNLKMQDQFPEFTQHLLQAIQPNYLAPTPSMCVVAFEPKPGDDALVNGAVIERGSELTASLSGYDTQVRYRTGHEVRLLPLKIETAEYLPSRTAIAPYLADASVKAEAGLRIRFASVDGVPLHAVPVSEFVSLYVSGTEQIPGELYRQILGDTVAAVSQPLKAGEPTLVKLPKPEASGFSDAEALLPCDGRSFRGYRLLCEYFACPERFLFVGLGGLAKAFAQAEAYCDVVLLFSRRSPVLVGAIKAQNLRLHATPAINLFEKAIDSVTFKPEEHEFLLMPDRAKPMDFEVFRVVEISARDKSGDRRPVAPLYSPGTHLSEQREALFYVNRLKHRRLSTREQRLRRRTDYTGTETFLSLTAPGNPDLLSDIKDLRIRALVTNRELPELQRFDGRNEDMRTEAFPVKSIAVLRPPTRPRPPLGLGDAAWRVIAHLTPNFASLADDVSSDPSMLRDHLTLYGQEHDPVMSRQIDGIIGLRAERVTRRVGVGKTKAFARGTRIRVTLDDGSFDNGLMYVFACIVDRFLGEFASVNSFVETVFESRDQGEFAAWPPRAGLRPTI